MKPYEHGFRCWFQNKLHRVVLLNLLGGIIHCNYDLLLRHTLRIVGEVKFTVYYCLLGFLKGQKGVPSLSYQLST